MKRDKSALKLCCSLLPAVWLAEDLSRRGLDKPLIKVDRQKLKYKYKLPIKVHKVHLTLKQKLPKKVYSERSSETQLQTEIKIQTEVANKG